jgi:tetratricopeptide (TPR) repeat protein
MNQPIKRGFLIAGFFISLLLAIEAREGIKAVNDQAVQLYRDGNYDRAVKIWYDLMKSGNTDSHLYYNVGSAEALLGHTAESILAFEKALRFNPSDQEIKDAIKRERSKIENAVIPVTPFFLVEWWHTFLSLLRPGGWGLIGLLLFITGLILWLGPEKWTNKIHVFKGKNVWAIPIAGFLFILTGFLAYYQLHRTDEAVVMISCECHKAPDADSPLTRTIHPGEKVKITDQIAEWQKVSLLNLDEGWVKNECLQQIEIGKQRD